MSDLARDPVFGEVARAVQPRATGIHWTPSDVPIVLATHDIVFRYTSDAADELRSFLALRPGNVHAVDATVYPSRGEYPDGTLLQWRGGRLALDYHERGSVLANVLCEAARHRSGSTAAPCIMGVVNVTPDSFSDGGNFLDPSRAVDHALRLVEEGADLLDVGGESTRPHAEPVALDEELRRVVPVVEALAKRTETPISIDTTKSEVARAALDAGATIVNDVSAGRFDPRILAVTAAHHAGFVAMHMQGDPRTMQAAPEYGDVVADVLEHLRERCFLALDAGVERSKLWIDPGIGFGKSLEHNLELLRRLAELRSLGLPIVLGVSRKSFITKITGRDTPPDERIGGTAAALAIGVVNGAEILRVHDVATMREAALVARAIAGR